MKNYITEIKVNRIFHLHDFSIKIDENNPHLLLTGKNGSGKTVLLNAISEHLDKIKEDVRLDFLEEKRWLNDWETRSRQNLSVRDKAKAEENKKFYEKRVNDIFGKVELNFFDIPAIIKSYSERNFVFAFYQADRKVKITEPKNPEKPNISVKTNLKTSISGEFLKYLVDLKVQRALASQEKGNEEYVNEIEDWFSMFEGKLKQLFHDDSLELLFDIKTYAFHIVTNGKKFKFTELSDGYAAILDIVVDLILKMQEGNRLTREFQKGGVVLIDEIETHLHLELQKEALPILTTMFPNVQFIVTTHSPFVLNSLDNAVAFDLEHQETIDDLNEYSYSSLVEGYFDVDMESSYIKKNLKEFETLLVQNRLSSSDKLRLKDLKEEFDKMSEIVFPQIKGKYMQLVVEHSNLIKEL